MPGPPPKAAGRQRRNPRSSSGTLAVLPSAGLTPADIPKPPKRLSKPAAERWTAFWASPVSAAVDRDSDMGALHRWITDLDAYYKLKRVTDRYPLVEGSKAGLLRPNPLFARLAGLERNIQTAEAQFGMTPMARLRLGIALGGAKASLEGLMESLNADLDDDFDDDDDPRLEIIDVTAAGVDDPPPARAARRPS